MTFATLDIENVLIGLKIDGVEAKDVLEPYNKEPAGLKGAWKVNEDLFNGGQFSQIRQQLGADQKNSNATIWWSAHIEVVTNSWDKNLVGDALKGKTLTLQKWVQLSGNNTPIQTHEIESKTDTKVRVMVESHNDTTQDIVIHVQSTVANTIAKVGAWDKDHKKCEMSAVGGGNNQ